MENEEVNYYKPRFAKWIKSDKWDSIAEKLSDISMETITQVMNAEKDGDCSWIIWKNCDYVLDRIKSISKSLKMK
ncbi:MAG TPA: hypothetical protein DEB74_08365 [Lachnospiraceae bacterium]|nr:hypothetical protein [Lachnospiraceae bacterium]